MPFRSLRYGLGQTPVYVVSGTVVLPVKPVQRLAREDHDTLQRDLQEPTGGVVKINIFYRPGGLSLGSQQKLHTLEPSPGTTKETSHQVIGEVVGSNFTDTLNKTRGHP